MQPSNATAIPKMAAREELKTSGFMVNKAETHQARHNNGRPKGAVCSPGFVLGFNEAFPAKF